MVRLRVKVTEASSHSNLGNTELEASQRVHFHNTFVVNGSDTIFSLSLNILKAYQAIDRQLGLFPSDRDRFPNFSSEKKPILSRGASAPLKGEIHTAQYFHGRYYTRL